MSKELAAAYERIADLEHELRLAQDAAAQLVSHQAVTTIAKDLFLSWQCAEFVYILFRAYPAARSRWQLEGIITRPSGADEFTDSHLANLVTRIRKVQGKAFIDTIWSNGYSLSPSGRTRVEKALCL